MALSYMPQILRLWRRKRAEDVSALFPALNVVGRILAFSYAMHQGQTVFALGFLGGSLVRITFMTQVFYYRRLYGAADADPSPLRNLQTSHVR